MPAERRRDHPVYRWILLAHAIGGATLFGAHVYIESLMATAARTKESGGYMLIMLKASTTADRVMGAASGVTLIFGVWLVIDTTYSWGDLFVTIGLSAILLGFAIARFLMTPRFAEINAIIAESGPTDETAIEKMKSLGNLLHVQTLIVVVAFVFMILKPGI
jgi:hypothetical protein